MPKKSVEPQVIVLGGGGFSTEPRNPLLDRYILQACGKSNPRICFVATASGDSPKYITRFYRAFAKHRCRPSDLPLFKRDARDPARHLLSQDIIYVGGGNTANLLAIWRTHGIDRVMRQAWRRSIVLCGISAGMICWFECSVTDSFGPLAPLRDGLGLLAGSALPPLRRPKKSPIYISQIDRQRISGRSRRRRWRGDSFCRKTNPAMRVITPARAGVSRVEEAGERHRGADGDDDARKGSHAGALCTSVGSQCLRRFFRGCQGVRGGRLRRLRQH